MTWRRVVEIVEVKHGRAGDYRSMVRLTVAAEKHTRAVTGTLLSESKVNVATFHLAATPPATW